jgi:hypothetical protein
MKRISKACTFLFLLILTAMAAAEIPASSSAQAFVSNQHLGKNLTTFAQATAQRTASFSVIAQKLGAAQAKQVVFEQIAQLLPKYQPQWDLNLATAFQQSFTEQELASLAAEGRSSKYAGKVGATQREVGKYMRDKSSPILAALVTEALTVAMAKHVK